jgi:hypothetical protein
VLVLPASHADAIKIILEELFSTCGLCVCCSEIKRPLFNLIIIARGLRKFAEGFALMASGD